MSRGPQDFWHDIELCLIFVLAFKELTQRHRSDGLRDFDVHKIPVHSANVLSREIDILPQWVKGQKTYASANV